MDAATHQPSIVIERYGHQRSEGPYIDVTTPDTEISPRLLRWLSEYGKLGFPIRPTTRPVTLRFQAGAIVDEGQMSLLICAVCHFNDWDRLQVVFVGEWVETYEELSKGEELFREAAPWYR